METTPSTAVANAKANLADSLHHMVDETDRLLKTAASSGDDRFEAVRSKVAEQLRGIRTQIADLEDSAKYKARHAARVTDRTVHEHPYSVIGVAAAVGLLIGFLVARR